MAVAADFNTCCTTRATCGDKNGPSKTPTPNNAVTDAECDAKSPGKIYNTAAKNWGCQGRVCNLALSADLNACCIVRATCKDKNGPTLAPSPSNPITNYQCNQAAPGSIYNTAGANNLCTGSVCNLALSADRSACCTAPSATCGDKNGATISPSYYPVTNAECNARSAGSTYNTAAASTKCQGMKP